MNHKKLIEVEFNNTYYQSIAVIPLPDYMDKVIRVTPPDRPQSDIIIEIGQNQFGVLITLRWFNKGLSLYEIRSAVPSTEKRMVEITYTSKQMDRQEKLESLLQVPV